MSIRISIIIPVYNVEKYIDRCMHSVTNQTFKDIEIILVDDGSTDTSSEKCDYWATKDNRVLVIHKTNGGLSSARNAGLEKATGEYILFIDSDDCVNYDICYKLYDMITKNDADIAIGSPCKFADIIPESKISDECMIVDKYFALEKASIDYKWVVAWGKLYKREIINTIRFPEGKLHEDEFIIHELYYKAQKIAFTNDSLYFYFYNTNGITGAKFSIRRMDVFEALNNRLEFYKKREEDLLYKLTVLETLKMMVNYSKLTKNYHDKSVPKQLKQDCKQLFQNHKQDCNITLWKFPQIYAYIYPASTPITIIVRVLKKIIH